MTREQTKTILATMAAVYPPNLMPQVTELTINVWFQLLQDIEYSMASAAVGAWLTTNKYPPTIADIRERLSRPTDSETPEAAWGTIIRAVRRFGYTDEPGALNSLSERSRAIVARFGWRYWCQMPIDEESTYYAQFRNAFNVEAKREVERRQIPVAIREKLGIGDNNEIALLPASTSQDEKKFTANLQQQPDREAVHNAVERLQGVLAGLRAADTQGSEGDAECAV